MLGRFSELAVFNAGLYIRVRRLDEPAERCGVRGRSRSQLHMTHELAGALQQPGRIRQRCAVKEPHVYVRGEYIDGAERRISQTCNWTAVMQKLPDFVPAFSHHLKPLTRDGSQSTCMPFHPRIDGGIPLNSAVESQQFRSHRRSTGVRVQETAEEERGAALRQTSAAWRTQVSVGSCASRRTDFSLSRPPVVRAFFINGSSATSRRLPPENMPVGVTMSAE